MDLTINTRSQTRLLNYISRLSMNEPVGSVADTLFQRLLKAEL